MHRARAGAASVIARAALRKERKAKRVHESRVCASYARAKWQIDRRITKAHADRREQRKPSRTTNARAFVSFVPSPFFPFLLFFLFNSSPTSWLVCYSWRRSQEGRRPSARSVLMKQLHNRRATMKLTDSTDRMHACPRLCKVKTVFLPPVNVNPLNRPVIWPNASVTCTCAPSQFVWKCSRLI